MFHHRFIPFVFQDAFSARTAAAAGCNALRQKSGALSLVRVHIKKVPPALCELITTRSFSKVALEDA